MDTLSPVFEEGINSMIRTEENEEEEGEEVKEEEEEDEGEGDEGGEDKEDTGNMGYTRKSGEQNVHIHTYRVSLLMKMTEMSI